MAVVGPEAVQGRLPRVVAVALIAGLGLIGGAPVGSADPEPGGGDRGVRTGGNVYQPYAISPGSRRNASPGAVAAAHPSTSRAGNEADGCTVQGAMVLCPKCADPAGTGICDAPTASVSPETLARRAWHSLNLPVPAVHTAPPRGSRGLVGLPEWVWVPRAQWRPLSRTASAGAVWAQVTATPERLSIEPGAGLDRVSCLGPGTAYDRVKPASAQRTDCSYTYRRSSAHLPGGVYEVTVTVVWSGRWVGSGGAGGVLPELTRSTRFRLPVAEAQGLYQ